MKLVRNGPEGSERPGVIDAAGGEALPRVSVGSRIGRCLAQPGNFIAIGLNYAQHARETNSPIPMGPIIFNKAPSCEPNDTVLLPKDSKKSDWEVEIAFVIGKQAHDVSEQSNIK